MHYLAKETNTKIASFHSMSYDYFILKTSKNTLCIDCISFHYRNSLQQMFEVFFLRENTPTDAFSTR